MKVIYNKSTQTVIWEGGEYLVNGEPATVDDPCVLLNVVTVLPPEYDATTHTISALPYAMRDGQWRNDYKVTPIPPKDLATSSIAAAGIAAFESLSPAKQILWQPTRDALAALIREGKMADALGILSTMPTLYEDMDKDRQSILSALTPPIVNPTPDITPP